jgi:tripartite-type tricarboxylate transporter receptor subunit TctC
MNRRDGLKAMGATMMAAALPSSLPFWPALAQTKYPDRPIRVIVPYAPGGVVDVMARHWGERMKSVLGSVVIENQGGGGGTLGASNVARAQPDGYTLLFGDTSSQIITPSLMASPPYDPVTSFAAISIIATSTPGIVVHPSVPVKDFAEFIKYAQANAEKLSYGSAGPGTVGNLAGELFKQTIKAPGITHIPYRGAGPAFADLIAGTTPMATPNVTGQVLESHRAGKVRLLAVCGPARLKAAPDIPAAVESLPGMVVQLSAGVFAPAGTPQPIVLQISNATAEAVKDPEFIRVLEAAGLETRQDASAAAAQAFLESERKRLVPVIQAAGMKAL